MVVYRRGTVMDVYTASCDLVVPQLSHVHSRLAASNVQRNAAGLQILVLDVDPDAEHGYDRLLELEATVRSTALLLPMQACVWSTHEVSWLPKRRPWHSRTSPDETDVNFILFFPRLPVTNHTILAPPLPAI